MIEGVFMKFNIIKNLRTGLIVTASLIICVLAILLFLKVNYTSIKDKKLSLYKYNNRANINYEVLLKPNALYNNSSIDEGSTYITEFIKLIKASFDYEFSGERTADIIGDYEIIAEVEGYTGEKDTYKSIWKKDYIISPKTSFNTKDKALRFKKDIRINLQGFNAFANKIIQDSKIQSSAKLSIFMNVNLKAKAANRIIEDKVSPVMVIPLNTSYFDITGNLSIDKPGVLNETIKVKLPVKKAVIIMFVSLIVIMIASLLFLILFTVPVSPVSPTIKMLNSIFKNHGDRLAAMNSDISIKCDNCYKVNSIDDLVRIADEISKPILYKYSYNVQEITQFYIIDNNQIYLFDIKDALPEVDGDDTNKKEREAVVNKYESTDLTLVTKSTLSKKEENDSIDFKS